MRVAVLIAIVGCLMVTVVAAAQRFPLVGLIFEYTVAPDGTRQNIRIVSIEQPITHENLSSLLTEAEKSRGIRNVSKRKRPGTKEAGHKRYEVAIFDLRTRKYVAEE